MVHLFRFFLRGALRPRLGESVNVLPDGLLPGLILVLPGCMPILGITVVIRRLRLEGIEGRLAERLPRVVGSKRLRIIVVAVCTLECEIAGEGLDGPVYVRPQILEAEKPPNSLHVRLELIVHRHRR